MAESLTKTLTFEFLLIMYPLEKMITTIASQSHFVTSLSLKHFLTPLTSLVYSFVSTLPSISIWTYTSSPIVTCSQHIYSSSFMEYQKHPHFFLLSMSWQSLSFSHQLLDFVFLHQQDTDKLSVKGWGAISVK